MNWEVEALMLICGQCAVSPVEFNVSQLYLQVIIFDPTDFDRIHWVKISSYISLQNKLHFTVHNLSQALVITVVHYVQYYTVIHTVQQFIMILHNIGTYRRPHQLQ